MDSEVLFPLYIFGFILIVGLRIAWPFIMRDDESDNEDPRDFTDGRDKSTESLRNILEIQNTLARENEENKKVLSEKEKNDLLKPSDYERLNKESKIDYNETTKVPPIGSKKIIQKHEFNVDYERWSNELNDYLERLKNVDDRAIANVLIAANAKRLYAQVITEDSAYNQLDSSYISYENFDEIYNLSEAIDLKVKTHQSNEDYNLAGQEMIWLHSCRGILDYRLIGNVRDLWRELERGRPLVDTMVDFVGMHVEDRELEEIGADWICSEAKGFYPVRISNLEENMEYSIPNKNEGILPPISFINEVADILSDPLLLQKNIMESGSTSTKFISSPFSLGFISGWTLRFVENNEEYIFDYFSCAAIRDKVFLKLFPENSEFGDRVKLELHLDPYIDGQKIGRKAAFDVSFNTKDKKQGQMAWLMERSKYT